MKIINLNYDWKYSEVFDEKFIAPEADDTTFEVVNIPHANKEIPYNNFDEEMYQFISCYRKHLDIPTSYKGKKLILEFEAVAVFAEVFVNGKFAFSHKGGYTAFRGDIAPLVNYGEDNVITVKVDSTERSEIPPFGGVVDYLCYGGIYREVFLYVHDDIYIENLLLTPIDVMTKPQLGVNVILNAEVKDFAVNLSVKNADGKEVANAVAKINGKSGEYVFNMPNAILWDLDNPYLYTVVATFGAEEMSQKCGLRKCLFKNKGFFLNDKHVKILGLNRHQAYPYVGYAMPKSAQEADAILLKQHLGVNLVRTSHYVNSRHFLNKCDELGLLVFTEIPGWQFVSQNAEWRQICLQHVQEMITEGYNHPSIILWGVRINEGGDDEELYLKTNALAHSLDKSRQTGGVRCFPHSQLLEDVYTFNDFIHSGGKMKLLPKAIVCGHAPLLITEYGGHMFPTKTFDHEKKRQENALRHERVIDKMYSSNARCGCIGWCMSDYNTHKDFGSGDKICYHGVTDMFRMDKLSSNVYKIQQRKQPVLELSSNMEIGDNAGGQVGEVFLFTNCDQVVMYKNGLKINTLDMKNEWAKSSFKHVPTPVVPLSDIIGDQLEHDATYKFTKHDATGLKKALLAIKKYGTFGGIARHPFALVKCLIKYKMDIASITQLFGQYVTAWGGKQVTYKLEGYMDGKLVIVTEKGSVNAVSMSVNADCNKLVEADTYDVVRVEIKAMSQCNNVMPYDNSVIEIATNGIVDIIGDDKIALIGGQRAVWFKTNGKSGKAEITFTSPTLGAKTITLDVSKK